MHKPTLAAGGVILFLGINLVANAISAILSFCYGDETGFAAESALDYCLFGYFGFQFLLSGIVSAGFVSAIGIWLIVLGLKSISAKTVMTKTVFVIGFLAGGITLLLVSMLSVFLAQFDQEVAFGYSTSVFDYASTLIPVGIIAFLLGLAGLFMYYAKSPARLLMWVLVFVAMVTASALAAFDSPIGLVIGIAAFVATYWLLRKQIAVARNIIVAAVILGSIGILAAAIAYAPVFFGFGYEEIKPEVTVARNEVIDTVDGIALTRVDNASRVLPPSCLRDDPADCRERYGEGLAELEMYHGMTKDSQQQIVSSSITNTGTSIINVTDFSIHGSSQVAYTELVAYGVESSDGISFGGPPFFFFGFSQDNQSNAPITDLVTLKPGESLSMYIKGDWRTDSGESIAAFSSSALYNYYVEPLILYNNTPEQLEENFCIPGCDTAPRIISNPQHWSLGTDYYYFIDSANQNETTTYIGSPAISYAGCMSEQDATQLFAKRNLAVDFPTYYPEGFSSVCLIDADAHSVVQILANATGMQREDIRQDPRILNDASIEDKGGVIRISTQLTPWQNFNETAFEEYVYYVENNDAEFIGKTSFQVIKGNSVVIEENYWGTSVEVNMNGREYRISGMVPDSELLKVAKSMM